MPEDATGGDYFHVEDLVPGAEKSPQFPAGLRLEYTPGKRYWVSDASDEVARKNKTSRVYVASVGDRHIFASCGAEDNYLNGKPFEANTWMYVVDIPEKTVMSLKEVEALLIRGDLVIKE